MRGGDRSSLRNQLEMITERAADLVTRHAACFGDEVRPKLSGRGHRAGQLGRAGRAERERLRTYFREQVFPVLTPLAVDPAHPFPYISSRSLNLAVVLRDPAAAAPSCSPGSRCRTTCRASSPCRTTAAGGASCRSRSSSRSTSTSSSPACRSWSGTCSG
jgi:hypothetical protein